MWHPTGMEAAVQDGWDSLAALPSLTLKGAAAGPMVAGGRRCGPFRLSGMTDNPVRKNGVRRRMGLRDLSPGFLTGVADDDPSNIATYSEVGARFGYQMIWTLWVFYPLVAVIQQVSAKMARATGKGLAANLRDHYPPRVGYFLVTMLLIANVINIGADLMAMGARRVCYSAACVSPMRPVFWSLS